MSPSIGQDHAQHRFRLCARVMLPNQVPNPKADKDTSKSKVAHRLQPFDASNERLELIYQYLQSHGLACKIVGNQSIRQEHAFPMSAHALHEFLEVQCDR